MRTGRRRVELLGRRRVHNGFFALDVLELRHERFDGSMTPVLDRELFVTRHAVSILPYDPHLDRILLVEQFRTGLVDEPGDPWTLEAPAGMLKPAEDPLEAARRELVEETGLVPRHVEKVLQFWPTPGAVSELQTMFVADVDLSDVGGIRGLAHENEDILTHVMSFTDALSGLERGPIRGASAVIGILWLQGRREALRRSWCECTIQTELETPRASA